MTVPQRIGKYEIAEQIGVGGFGVVYKAWDPYIQRWVALKTCAGSDTEATQRFFREAQLAGALQHPNITLIFDFGIEDGVPYFVQEFLSGTDLDELTEKKKLSIEGVLAILIQVCTGVEFAHSRGIIHRDLKPANVRVLEDGTVKIMDFGIARSIQAESRLTQTGVALGTAGYLAPEQLSGKPLDARTDLFSLGVMAYELVAGVRPFAGPSISNVIYQILHQEPVPLRQRDPRTPERLERAVAKAIAKNPEQRYASTREFAQDLKTVLEGLSSRTRARRQETTTALVRGELSRTQTATEGARQVAGRTLDQLPTDHVDLRAGRRRRPVWWLGAAAIGLVAVAGASWLLVERGRGEQTVLAAIATPVPLASPPPAATPAAPEPTAVPALPTLNLAVTVLVDPPSEVEVDGRPLGRIQSAQLELSPGPHRFLQRIPGYSEKVHTFEVRPEATTVMLNLPPFGMLSVLNDFGVSVQGARVFLDQRDLGPLPLRDRKVAAGTRELRVVWPDGGEYRETIEVGAGQVLGRTVAPAP